MAAPAFPKTYDYPDDKVHYEMDFTWVFGRPPQVDDLSLAQHDHLGAAGGGQLAGYAALDVEGLAAQSAVPSRLRTKRQQQVLKNYGATTLSAVGAPFAPVLTGTLSSTDTGTQPFLRLVESTGLANGSAGVLEVTNLVGRVGNQVEATFVVKTGGVITDYRHWTGLTSADLTAVATPTTQHVAAFRYDTGVDGTAYWRTVTCDGTTATVTTTAAAVALGTTYTLRVVTDAASVKFYVDGVLVATHTTNLPGAATGLGFQASVTNLIASARRVEVSRLAFELN